jgi:mannose-6-phosphate isomerase-like protein (cupin superfamily)
MTAFTSRPLPDAPDVTAPDGSDVRLLCALDGGSMAHFSLAPGRTSRAVAHRTVEEIWFVIAGAGEMWRARDGAEEVTPLVPGLSLTIPVGTRFQFRCTGPRSLEAVAITMPPWPGEGEAMFVDGRWQTRDGD